MPDLNTLRPRKDIRQSGAANPTVSTVAKIGERYQNTVSLEIFACVDIVTLAWGTYYAWAGTQGALIDPDILSSSNANLVAMYTMDNISGATLVDESPNNNDGAITGAVAVAGQIGNALSFDGGDDKVDTNITGATAGTQGALSCWVTRQTDAPSLISDPTDTYNFLQLVVRVGDGRMQIDSRNAGSSVINRVQGTIVIPDDSSLHNVVWQSDGATWEIYVDGVKDTLTSDVGSNVGDWFGDRGTSNITMSYQEKSGTDSYFSGVIDQWRLFNRTLTQAEVTALYNEGNP